MQKTGNILNPNNISCKDILTHIVNTDFQSYTNKLQSLIDWC